jgi:alkanesulfonate monooxygenase SsuD/methylene tetrahydromethanopterin reductase-like flavin-dependent oxidoreductase (luciferase family)
MFRSTLSSERLFLLLMFMSGFGEKAVELAGRIADGYMSTRPDLHYPRPYRESCGRESCGRDSSIPAHPGYCPG